MDDTIRMQVIQSLDELFCHLLDSCFRQPLIVLQNIKQLSLRVFRNDTEVTFRFKGIKHEDNVLMVQLSQNTDLLTKVLNVLFTLSVFVYKLHGHGETGVLSPRLTV